ncbi:MAG: RNA polymerase sigma factor [Candidatus Aminicenantes bacterium]|nr:MAG: RNA polymerase sigma factor [Candidatus Aminicenantes bacterium]
MKMIIMRVMTDEQIVQLLKEGQAAAADELYKKHAKSLYVYLSHVLNVSNPEDSVHDVFIRVIEKAHQFNLKKASFRTWLFRIAHNHAINLFRREKLVRFQSLEQNIGHDVSGKELHLGDTLADESQNLDKSSLVLAVRECIRRLRKEVERQAIVMYYILGKNYEEISGVFGKSVSAVRKYVMSAGEKVRECLEAKGIGVLG